MIVVVGTISYALDVVLMESFPAVGEHGEIRQNVVLRVGADPRSYISEYARHHPMLRLSDRLVQSLGFAFALCDRRLRTDRTVGIHVFRWCFRESWGTGFSAPAADLLISILRSRSTLTLRAMLSSATVSTTAMSHLTGFR